MPTFTPGRALLLATSCRAGGLQRGPQKQGGAAAPAVTVATPIKRIVVDQDEYVGRFVAVDSVEIRARVSGYLDRIDFTDGQMVKQGDLLFTVDKRPFQTDARSGQGQSRAGAAPISPLRRPTLPAARSS